ncbi:RNA-binding protein [Glugoides intestinalis]
MGDQSVEALRAKLLTDESKIKTLEAVLQSVEKSQKACKEFWESDELIFSLLQNFTDSFYILNTERFDDKEIYKIRLSIDILTNIVKKICGEESFLKIQLDYYIYPFLMSCADELLKVSALKLFSALLKNGVPECMRSSELLPLLLKIIDSNNESCQLLGLETLDLILSGFGLDYAVQTLDRFQAIDVVLSSQMKKAILSRNNAFLKLLLKIYLRLCDKNNVKMKLKEKLPEGLETKEMMQICEKDNDLATIRTKFCQLFS